MDSTEEDIRAYQTASQLRNNPDQAMVAAATTTTSS